MGFSDDIRLERRHSSTIAGILGREFIVQDAELDWKQATDFAVFNVRPFKVAARLRTHRFLKKYSEEFTIRWLRPSGVATEIHKIRQGFGDYMIYGFVSEDESHIVQYFIGDLDVFREREPAPIFIGWNDPPDSQLAAWRINQLPPSFVLKKWGGIWTKVSP